MLFDDFYRKMFDCYYEFFDLNGAGFMCFTPRLRGNTFFLLVLQAGKNELGIAPSWGCSSEGLTRSQLFADLIRTVSPSYRVVNEKTLMQYLSQYLDGSRPSSATYYPFKDKVFQNKVDIYVREDYPSALASMDRLCHKYLACDDEYKMKLLVGGLIDLILEDRSVKGEFNTGMKVVHRGNIGSETEFNLPTFLLSVWSYIIVNKPDAEEGAETYAQWTEDAGGGNPRRYVGPIAKERAKKLAISIELPETGYSADTAHEPRECLSEDSCSIEHADDSPAPENKPSQQELTISGNGRIYNQHADKIVNIEHVDMLNI